jgi:hypothetical protein
MAAAAMIVAQWAQALKIWYWSNRNGRGRTHIGACNWGAGQLLLYWLKWQWDIWGSNNRCRTVITVIITEAGLGQLIVMHMTLQQDDW